MQSQLRHTQSRIQNHRSSISTESIKSKERRDQFGEVFTPRELVDEILDQLPIDWSDTSLTFYDPAAGEGQFPIEVVQRLFDAQTQIENEEERLNNILNNQIFLNELQEDNAEICSKFFPNVTIGDALDKYEKYDITIGNPPYQNSSSKTQTNKLWYKFIEHCFAQTRQYLAFITPDPWTHPISSKSKYKRLFREKQLLYADIGRCARHFPGIGSSFTWFLLKNAPPTEPTTLVTSYKEMQVNFVNWPWIPNRIDDETLHALVNTLWGDNEKINYIGSQLPKKYHSKGQTEVFKYPFCLSTSTISWREEKCTYHDKPKVMFPYLASHTKPILDEGTMGATHGVNLIFDTVEQAKAAFDFYCGQDMQIALRASKWHHGNANPQVLKALPRHDIY